MNNSDRSLIAQLCKIQHQQNIEIAALKGLVSQNKSRHSEKENQIKTNTETDKELLKLFDIGAQNRQSTQTSVMFKNHKHRSSRLTRGADNVDDIKKEEVKGQLLRDYTSTKHFGNTAFETLKRNFIDGILPFGANFLKIMLKHPEIDTQNPEVGRNQPDNSGCLLNSLSVEKESLEYSTEKSLFLSTKDVVTKKAVTIKMNNKEHATHAFSNVAHINAVPIDCQLINNFHQDNSLSMNSTLFASSTDEQNSSQDCSFLQPTEIKPFSAIPGPWPSLPFVGTGWQYFPLIGRYDLGKLHEAHLAKFHDYGPIVREEYQWGRPILHIFDPQDFETVFRSQGRCPVRPPNEFVTSLRSRKPEMYPNVGFANLNGEPWLELRQKLAPAIMKMRAIIETVTDQNCILDEFLDYLSRENDSEMFVFENIQEACYRLALESICLVCLGSRIGSFLPEDNQNSDENSSSGPSTGNRLIEATKLMFDSFNRLYYGPSFWKYFSTGAYSDLERSENEIYQVTSRYIEAEIVRLMNEPEGGQKYNVLQTLLATPGLSVEDVKVTVIDFIAGGIFTVSNSLAYLFYHLASNPEAQQKVADEIEQVKANRSINTSHTDSFSDEWINALDIASMSYLKACVRESFRLNCPVPGIMRVTSKALVLSGYNVPENTVVLSHIMSTCRLEKYFPEADRFKPERWLGSEERSKIHPFASLPFGFGSRMCVGKRFSENEIYLATARVISKYRIELLDNNSVEQNELELKHAFIVIPAKPISLKFIKR